MGRACVNHDICYGTPGKTKDRCDAEFGAEIIASSMEGKGIYSAGFSLLWSAPVSLVYEVGVRAGGQGAYEEAQKNGIICYGGQP